MTTASRSSAASSLRHSAEIDQVEDEDDHIRDISPSNASLIESSDGSNDSHLEIVGRTRSRSSSIIAIDDDALEEVPDEAERGMTHESISNRMLTVH
jgi:hypothetical protein